jgi:hypothetical protein
MTVTSTSVPRSVYNHVHQFNDPGGAGPSVHFQELELQTFIKRCPRSRSTPAMTRDAFKILFNSALETAADNAGRILGRAVPRVFAIEMHGLAPMSRTLTVDEAFDEIDLGPERFYRVIDLAVLRVTGEVTTIFMRVSGHPPDTFEKTWNQPVGNGPFKQLLLDGTQP